MPDILERIGRDLDIYHRFHLAPTLIEVSPEVHAEITSRLRSKTADDAVPVTLRFDRFEVPYRINPKLVGATAYRIETGLRVIPPEVAIRRAYARRSDAVPHELFRTHPKLRLS